MHDFLDLSCLWVVAEKTTPPVLSLNVHCLEFGSDIDAKLFALLEEPLDVLLPVQVIPDGWVLQDFRQDVVDDSAVRGKKGNVFGKVSIPRFKQKLVERVQEAFAIVLSVCPHNVAVEARKIPGEMAGQILPEVPVAILVLICEAFGRVELLLDNFGVQLREGKICKETSKSE